MNVRLSATRRLMALVRFSEQGAVMVDLGRKAQRNPMAVGVSVFAAMLMMSGLAQASPASPR